MICVDKISSMLTACLPYFFVKKKKTIANYVLKSATREVHST